MTQELSGCKTRLAVSSGICLRSERAWQNKDLSTILISTGHVLTKTLIQALKTDSFTASPERLQAQMLNQALA